MSDEGGSWKNTLADRLTSPWAIGFYIIVLGAVARKMDVGIFGTISDEFVKIIKAIKQ